MEVRLKDAFRKASKASVSGHGRLDSGTGTLDRVTIVKLRVFRGGLTD